MAEEPPQLSADDERRLRLALGNDAIHAEACAVAATMPPVARTRFVAAVVAARRAGEAGLRAIWLGLAAASGSAKRSPTSDPEGGASGDRGVCEGTQT